MMNHLISQYARIGPLKRYVDDAMDARMDINIMARVGERTATMLREHRRR